MKYIECKDYIRSDYFRGTGKQSDSLLKMFMLSFTDIGFRYMFWFRLTQCDKKIISIVARICCLHLGNCLKITIPRETTIGYGFRIGHGGPVVINGTAVIGDNVNMGQFSTIGSMFRKAATIGNNVYIGPSVCIVENVKIGDGVTIGAGSVVVKDAVGGVTIAGNPARVISHKEPGRLIWKKWNREWNNYKG